MRLVGAVLAQSALITALLAYFGWVRTNALYQYFGVSARTLGLSADDYVLNTPALAVPLILAATLVGLVALAAIRGLKKLEERRPRAAGWTFQSLTAAGLVVAVVGLLFFGSWNPLGLNQAVRPLPLGLGLLLMVAARHAHHPRAWSPVTLATVLVAVGTTFIWSWSLYANDAGITGARTIAATLPSRDAVFLYSKEQLAIDERRGVIVHDLGALSQAYRFRYDGLRLLATTQAGDLLLLPIGWRKGLDPIFFVHADTSVRWDIIATP